MGSSSFDFIGFFSIMSRPGYNDSVFINYPFDDDYKPILRAIVHAIYRCGFFPQSAMDEDDGTDVWLLKIIRKMRGLPLRRSRPFPH